MNLKAKLAISLAVVSLASVEIVDAATSKLIHLANGDAVTVHTAFRAIEVSPASRRCQDRQFINDEGGKPVEYSRCPSYRFGGASKIGTPSTYLAHLWHDNFG